MLNRLGAAFSVTAILAFSLIYACGGGGKESENQTTLASDYKIYTSEITDPDNPFAAISVDNEGNEAIGVGVNKDANGNITNITNVVVSDISRNTWVNIILGEDGLPSSLVNSEGNEVRFLNYSGNNVDVAFYDNKGQVISGPLAIEIDLENFTPLQEIHNALVQRSLPDIQTREHDSDGKFIVNYVRGNYDKIKDAHSPNARFSDWFTVENVLKAASYGAKGTVCAAGLVAGGIGGSVTCLPLVTALAKDVATHYYPELKYVRGESCLQAAVAVGSGDPVNFAIDSVDCLRDGVEVIREATSAPAESGSSSSGSSGSFPTSKWRPDPPTITAPGNVVAQSDVNVITKRGGDKDNEMMKIVCEISGPSTMSSYESQYAEEGIRESFTFAFAESGWGAVSCWSEDEAGNRSWKASKTITIKEAEQKENNEVGGNAPGLFTLTASAYCNSQPPVGPAVMLKWSRSEETNSYDVYRNGDIYAKNIVGLSFDNNANVSAGNVYSYYVVAKNGKYITRSNIIDVAISDDICNSNDGNGESDEGSNDSGGDGAGASTQINIDRTSLDFGNVNPGDCSTSTFSVKHVNGTEQVTGSVSVGPSPPYGMVSRPDFSVSSGQSRSIEIKFCPTSEGSFSGKAEVSASAVFTGASSVALTGTSGSTAIPPTVSISSPDDGATYSQGSNIAFSGSASDANGNSITGNSLVWASSIDGQIRTGSSFTKSNLSAGKQTITLTATDGAGITASKSITITVNPIGNFSLSGATECTGGDNKPQIRLTWNSVSGAGYYIVFRNGSNYHHTYSPNATSYLDTDVTSGAQYTYFVRAMSSGNNAILDSNSVTITAPDCQTTTLPPGPITVSGIAMCNGQAPRNHLDHTGSANVDPMYFPYEVYRNGSKIATFTSGNGYDDDSVSPGATYSYFVRAKNEAGSRDSNTISLTAKSDCAAPATPSISSISPSSATVGDGNFTLTVHGQNFDQFSVIHCNGSPKAWNTYVNNTTLSANVSQSSSGYGLPLCGLGQLSISVAQLQNNGSYANPSNSVTFSVYNPAPVINSISGTCRAGYNCTPANGYDVRINGSGFVGTWNGSKVYFNGGSEASPSFAGFPVTTQIQLSINGSLIPTPGTYTIKVCNPSTASGTVCSTGSLTVVQ